MKKEEEEEDTKDDDILGSCKCLVVVVVVVVVWNNKIKVYGFVVLLIFLLFRLHCSFLVTFLFAACN